MKVTIISVILSIIAIIGGVLLNFEEVLWNEHANIKNLVVTLSYMSVWGLFLLIAAKSKSQGNLNYFFWFWLSTLLSSVIVAFVQANPFSLSVVFAPFLTLLIPFYGIRCFVEDFVSLSIIIAAISFGMSLVGYILLRRFK